MAFIINRYINTVNFWKFGEIIFLNKRIVLSKSEQNVDG
jgi:hypothetical protein